MSAVAFDVVRASEGKDPWRPAGISAEAWEIAERRAAEDKALLARLVAEGKVFRDPRVVPQRAEQAPKRNINLAIRPKKKRR